MKARRVFVHCSATADSGDRIGLKDIDAWHRAKGWSQVGYHRIIRRTGLIEKGRPDNVPGAHVKGHNHDSLGICWVGTKSPSHEQIVSILQLYQEFKIHWSQWFGHSEIVNFDKDPNNNKDCPGLPMTLLRFLLANFDDHQFDLSDTTQVKNFLLVGGICNGK